MESLLPLEVITFNYSSYFIINNTLYACGLNPLGLSKGEYNVLTKNFNMNLNLFSKMVINASSSQTSASGFILIDDELYGAGDNFAHVLGTVSDDYYYPNFFKYDYNVSQIESNGKCSYLIQNNKLYVTGYSRLPSYLNAETFTEIRELINVTKFFMNVFDNFYVISDNKLYVGGVSSGSLGINTNSNIDFTFLDIDITNLVTISAFNGLTFIICTSKVYKIFNNIITEYQIANVSEIILVDDFYILIENNLYATDINLTIGTRLFENVTQLNGSYNDSNVLFCISNNILYGIGHNFSHQLGLPNDIYDTFTEITTNVKKVICNKDGTFIIKTNGQLYASGNNTDYQLALPLQKMYEEFTPVNGVNDLTTHTVYSTRPPKTSLATKITTKSALTILENNLQNRPFGYASITIDKSAFTSAHDTFDTVTSMYAIQCQSNATLLLDDVYFDDTTLIFLPTKNYTINLKSDETVSIISNGIDTFVNNKLLALGGKRIIGNYNMTLVANGSSAILLEYVPTSPICFPAGTPILTDQGYIPIDKITTQTLHNKPIQLTKTISTDKYLVCFEKDSLEKNVPFQRTIMSKDHMVYYKEYCL